MCAARLAQLQQELDQQRAELAEAIQLATEAAEEDEDELAAEAMAEVQRREVQSTLDKSNH